MFLFSEQLQPAGKTRCMPQCRQPPTVRLERALAALHPLQETSLMAEENTSLSMGTSDPDFALERLERAFIGGRLTRRGFIQAVTAVTGLSQCGRRKLKRFVNKLGSP